MFTFALVYLWCFYFRRSLLWLIFQNIWEDVLFFVCVLACGHYSDLKIPGRLTLCTYALPYTDCVACRCCCQCCRWSGTMTSTGFPPPIGGGQWPHRRSGSQHPADPDLLWAGPWAEPRGAQIQWSSGGAWELPHHRCSSTLATETVFSNIY